MLGVLVCVWEVSNRLGLRVVYIRNDLNCRDHENNWKAPGSPLEQRISHGHTVVAISGG